MNAKEALEILEQVVGGAVMDGKSHHVAAQALEVLRQAIEPAKGNFTPPNEAPRSK